jgi:microcystin-dependent protein|tara:strand:+ start:2799 stop:3890 length:1092 start_codon:yes stop_codon:yes gene_type:complete
MSAKRPAGYAGPYTAPSENAAPGSYVAPTEAAALKQQGNWPAGFVPNTPPGILPGEIVAVLATGVIDAVNAAEEGCLSVASGFDVNRGDYYDLFTVYNTTFGVGDGSANFGIIDLPKTHNYLEGTTTSGLTYPSQYRSDSVMPEHTHELSVCTSLTIQGLYQNTQAGNTPSYTYNTDDNRNESERNEARHRQVIQCVAKKELSSPPIGSLQYVLAPNAQPGDMTGFGFNTVNYLIASGQNVSRTEYAELFNRIGTKYGTGDGSTTFGLPDFLGLFNRGAEHDDYITISGTDVSSSGYLGDKVVRHRHTRGGVFFVSGNQGNNAGGARIQGIGGSESGESSLGGAETRPKNITALYYLVANGGT